MQVKISFILLPSRKLSDGTCPIYCNVFLKGKIKRFSIGVSIRKDHWDLKKCQVKTKAPDSEHLNDLLQAQRLKIKQIYALHITQGLEIDLEQLMDAYRGRNDKEKMTKNLMELYAIKIEEAKRLIGKGYSRATLVKRRQMANALSSFLRFQYDSKDIPLTKINKGFISDLEGYLRVEKNMKLISINKVIQSLKSIVYMALDHKWIEENPFIGHRFKNPKTEVVFLTIDELKKIEEHLFFQPRLNMVKDMFLFSVYTGLHFSDAMSLTKDNLILGQDGNLWIEYTRAKTGRQIKIPLFSKAKKILEAFATYPKIGDRLIPKYSNQKVNSYLKEVADIAGIATPLTHKIARKTFGSVLLYHNTPMAVVSELMGHSSVLITQKHYAKLESRKLVETIRSIDHII